jgi:hypothetical protein
MTRRLSTALLALTLGFGTPAFAQDNPQLTTMAQNVLEEYGYEVDASVLSLQQLAEFQTYFGAAEDFGSDTRARNRIDEILMLDEGTVTFVSPDTATMMENRSGLEQNAREILDEAGFEEVAVNDLSQVQLAQLWLVRERDEIMNDQAALENYIQASVLDGS